MSELLFDDVSVRFGHGRHRITAVDGVTLSVPPGTVVGLVGESGSGKSTLARVAVGLTPASEGRVLVDGAKPRRRRWRGSSPPVQMVFQDPYSSLDPRMSIGDSICEAMPGRASGGRSARRAEASRLLELVQLDPDRMGMLPGGLSGGQRQRVALARALAARPSVIVADEITSSLDVSVQGAVLNLVRELQQELGLAMLFISHNLAVVRYLSDVIAVMYLGRIVEVGPAAELLADPRHPFTRELLAAAPLPLAQTSPLEAGEAGWGAAPTDPLDHRQQLASGCRFCPRCPVGPNAVPSRGICRVDDPQLLEVREHHRAACHFAASRQPSGREISG